ncbi:hypothetical protein SDC9_162889 [bioreactor metagenome]|uniref:Uncharacterized protein n=1 Tax=bioreactor metagenome TaxID=1076179 RepID=A0A645FMA7_9ZZZZ
MTRIEGIVAHQFGSHCRAKPTTAGRSTIGIHVILFFTNTKIHDAQVTVSFHNAGHNELTGGIDHFGFLGDG